MSLELRLFIRDYIDMILVLLFSGGLYLLFLFIFGPTLWKIVKVITGEQNDANKNV